MINKIIYVKLKDNCYQIEYFEKSYKEHCKSYFYNPNEKCAEELNINDAALELNIIVQ